MKFLYAIGLLASLAPFAAASLAIEHASMEARAHGSDDGENILTMYPKAHGVLMGLSAVILLPLGAIYMRVHGNPWVHAGIQLLTLVLMIAGLALGVKLAKFLDVLWAQPHTKLGVAIVVMALIQPVFGVWHHHAYVRTQARSPVSHVHIWLGRVVIVLAMINGGLGLQLAGQLGLQPAKMTRHAEIAWGVLAGIMAVGYTAAVVLRRKGTRNVGFRTKNEVSA